MLLAILLVASTAFLVGCASSERQWTAPAATTAASPDPPPRAATIRRRPAADPPVPAALFASGLDVRAGPVPVPLKLQIPSLNVDASVLGVGVTPGDVMDAPEGPVNDRVWQEAFWYRGSAVPGVISTALIAGHIDGPRGTEAVFGHIDQLRSGDAIIIHDARSGLDVRFAVTGSTSFSLDQTADKSVLTRIYGVGPVAGTTPQRSADGLAHLTLVTCAGTFRNGTHDHRLVVFATRIA
ncbi:MAG: class F sortase [Actinomycetota bacterium]|nr:class F sortase [Actinomycetota bacterium]